MRKQNTNHNNQNRTVKENNSFDLWNFNGEKEFENKGDLSEIRQIESYTRYHPQISVPTKVKETKQLSLIIQPKKKQHFKQASIPKKQCSNLNLGITDFNPDNIVKFLKNKFKEGNPQPYNDSSTQRKVKKPLKESDSIGVNLYQKKVLSNDYEMQKQLKKATDEQKCKQELSECTFKPKINANRPYDKNKKNKVDKPTKQNLYEKHNKWLDSINTKNEKKFEKKINEELEGCSFNPKINKMPNFASANVQYENETNELYYMRVKNARRLSQEKQGTVNYAQNYDNRKRRNNKTASMGTIELNNLTKKKPTIQQDAFGVHVDNDYEMKKNLLMQDLHDWNFNNTEADDDFF